MWATIAQIVLYILGFIADRAMGKKEMSKLMFDWIKEHRLTDFVGAFLDAERQNAELDGKPFQETGASQVVHPIGK